MARAIGGKEILVGVVVGLVVAAGSAIASYLVLTKVNQAKIAGLQEDITELKDLLKEQRVEAKEQRAEIDSELESQMTRIADRFDKLAATRHADSQNLLQSLEETARSVTLLSLAMARNHPSEDFSKYPMFGHQTHVSPTDMQAMIFGLHDLKSEEGINIFLTRLNQDNGAGFYSNVSFTYVPMDSGNNVIEGRLPDGTLVSRAIYDPQGMIQQLDVQGVGEDEALIPMKWTLLCRNPLDSTV